MIKYPPARLAGLTKPDPLPEGYESATVRLRARKEVLAWFGALTAAARGELVMSLYNERHVRQSEPVASRHAPSADAAQTDGRDSRQSESVAAGHAPSAAPLQPDGRDSRQGGADQVQVPKVAGVAAPRPIKPSALELRTMRDLRAGAELQWEDPTQPGEMRHQGIVMYAVSSEVAQNLRQSRQIVARSIGVWGCVPIT